MMHKITARQGGWTRARLQVLMDAVASGVGQWAAREQTRGVVLAKPNYQFEKRQRDLAKKQKQEEKRRQKLADKAAAQDSSAQTTANPAEDALPGDATSPAGETKPDA